jgi:hypothetical protein
MKRTAHGTVIRHLALTVAVTVIWVCPNCRAQELYVSLYDPNPDYLEVTLDARSIPPNAFISAVFRVDLVKGNGQTVRRTLQFSDRRLRPGAYRNFIPHNETAVIGVRGVNFTYEYGAGGAKADDPSATTDTKGTRQGLPTGLSTTSLEAAPSPQPKGASALRTFDAPSYRIDWCLHWGTQCGKPAADQFCRDMGYAGSRSFSIAENIGAQSPTFVIGDHRMCAQPECDGFSSLSCER